MKRLIALLPCLSFFICTQLPAQSPIFQSYTIQDGLVANSVRRFFQDSKGFIWIATWEGLSRYDGYRFTNFTTDNGLSHNLVNDLFEDNGKIYVALNNGTIDVIQNDHVEKVFSIPDNNFNGGVNRFLQLPNGKTLITTDRSGFFEYENGKFSKPVQEKPDWGCCGEIIGYNDNLFIGIADKLLSVFTRDYRRILRWTSQSGIIHLYQDREKRTWICTYKGIRLLSPLTQQSKSVGFLPLPAQFNIPQLNNAFVYDLFEDEAGNFWIATSKCLIKILPDGNHVVYNESNGFPSSFYNSDPNIFQDREKNIWIGLRRGVLKRSLQSEAEYIYKNNKRDLYSDIHDVTWWKNDELLLSTLSGIDAAHRQSGSIKRISRFSPQMACSFIQGSKPLLVYNNERMYCLDERTGRLLLISRFQLPLYGHVSCSDSSGNSFIALNDGVCLVSGKKLYTNRTLPDQIAALVADNDHYLWIGTFSEGLYRVHYAIEKDSLVFSCQDFTHLIGAKSIRKLFRDSKGNIWVGTRYSGAFCLMSKKDGYIVQHFNRNNGLLSDFIHAFAEAGNGDIWVGSIDGIDKLVKEKEGYRFFNFSNVSNIYGFSNKILREKNTGKNEWWLLLKSGSLVKFTDNGLEHLQPAPVFITVALFSKQANKAYLSGKDTVIKIKPNENKVQFAFTAPSYINEKQILYSYRMLGATDTGWSKPQNMHEVLFASLRPGNYTFQVRTLGWNGQFGTPAVFSFIISPPFWMTWWFVLLCIFFLATIILTVFRYRFNQLLHVQKVRNRIAADLHDEIGSALTNINILSTLSQENIGEPTGATRFLYKISEEATSSSQALDDIIWGVNINNDTLDETLARMRRYGYELLDNYHIQCHMDFGAPTGVSIEMEKRRDVYLVYKEILNNILKHAAASEVWISARVRNNQFHLTVKDNGKGFDPDMVTHRNGIKSMKARIGRWKGVLNITSGESGSTLCISVPMVK